MNWFRSWPCTSKPLAVFGDEGWVFGYGGTYFNRNSAADRWRQVREASRIGEFTLHDLRHFYASSLIADGCDVVTVQRAACTWPRGAVDHPEHLLSPLADCRRQSEDRRIKVDRCGPRGFCGLCADWERNFPVITRQNPD